MLITYHFIENRNRQYETADTLLKLARCAVIYLCLLTYRQKEMPVNFDAGQSTAACEPRRVVHASASDMPMTKYRCLADIFRRRRRACHDGGAFE